METFKFKLHVTVSLSKNYIGYSILTFAYAENREKYLGMGEAATGIGLMVGPVIGGLINTFFGYVATFLFFALILLLAGILCFFFLPKSLNDSF